MSVLETAQHLLRQVPIQTDPLWARQLERDAEQFFDIARECARQRIEEVVRGGQ